MDDEIQAALGRAVVAARRIRSETQSILGEVHAASAGEPALAKSKPSVADAKLSPAAEAASEDGSGGDQDDELGDEVVQNATKAFVSWAHAHPDWEAEQVSEWERQVATFAATLRASGGIDADVDLYHAADKDIDWTRYGPNRIDESEFILIVMSEAWADRWSGRNAPTVGAGAVGEADALHGLFTKHQTDWQRRVKIIMFPDVSDSAIPNDLARVSRFYVNPDDLDSYDSLLRALTAQPRHIPPPLASVPVLAVADLRLSKQTRASQTRREKADHESLQDRLGEIERELANAPARSKQAAKLNSLRVATQSMLDALYDA